MVEMLGESRFSANAFRSDRFTEGELMRTTRTGVSAGLTLRYDGGIVISMGKRFCALNKAAWTSTAALSISRSLLNSSVMLVLPKKFVELMTLMPSIVENSFSSGKATEAAIFSGDAPGSEALTEIIGELKLGSAATGIFR